MKVLHVMPYSPVPQSFGGAIRVYHMLKNIALHNEVTVLTYGSPEDHRRLSQEFSPQVKTIHMVPKPWLRTHKRLGQFYALWTSHSTFSLYIRTREMRSQMRRILCENEFDVVQTEFSAMVLDELSTDALKILDAHNVEYDIFRRMWINTRSPLRKVHYYREYKTFFHEETEACRKQDAIFVTSERDKKLFDGGAPNVPKFVVPNGVDTSYFKPFNETPEPSSLVFTGMMGYLPNNDGALHFLDKIFPLIQKKIPEARVYIVGNRPSKKLLKRASDKVVITGYVHDVRPFVSRASVYVVPLRMGGGTRLKVMEAMAMKKPIVTTGIGCEGIDVVNGESALIVDEPQLFAEAVVELLHNAALRQRLIRNGYELVRSRYEWSAIGRQVEQLYQSLAAKAKAHNRIRVHSA